MTDQFKGKLGDIIARETFRLVLALTFQDEVAERLGKLYAYSHMRSDQDTNQFILSRF